MLILGIESATAQAGCAVGGHEGVLASVHSAHGRLHAESLAPQVEFVLRQARVSLRDVRCVAVDVGPGLYTGLRVGVASAKSLAYALDVPMIGASSLDLLAMSVRSTNRLIAAAVDARRGELFCACYRQVHGGVQRLTAPRVATPEDLFAELQAADSDVLLVGDGGRRYADVFAGLRKVDVADQRLAHPSAACLVELAHTKALREEFVTPEELQPVYLRAPDAEANPAGRVSP